jgi:ribosomal protein L11 methyltransferase
LGVSDVWIRADIETATAGIEPVGAMLLGICPGGYSVQDAADFESFLAAKSGRWDYIDSELMRLREAPTVLSVYLAGNAQGRENLEILKRELGRLRDMDASGEWGALSLTLADIREEDWATAWKQYYKPTPIGERLVICPSWESYYAQPHEVILRLDPGMAFGTGTHETTRMCLMALDTFDPRGKTVLDIGCGSGILAVAAMLLGAKSAAGIDIDEVAVQSARENAARNDVAADFGLGDLTHGVSGTYDIIFANIVADALIALAPDVPKRLSPGGVYITGGIIDEREAEVRDAMERAGIRITRVEHDNGWVCIVGVR